jgi:alpha-galactosidase
MTAPPWTILRRAGVMVVLDARGTDLPRLVHWGADLGTLDDDELAALPGPVPPSHDAVHDSPAPVTLVPTRAQGWAGRPGLTGHRDGHASQPLFALTAASMSSTDAGDVYEYRGEDDAAQLQIDGELQLTVDGVLRQRLTLTSTAPADAQPYAVDSLTALLPISDHATEVLDHAGTWAAEFHPQRHQLEQGTWLREIRRGRTGHDSPLVVAAGTRGFGTRAGDVWAVHLGWSGDQRYLAERLDTGTTLLGAGEILGAGEVRLGPGESLSTPWVYGAWSDAGLDGIATRMHGMLRRRPQHPRGPRPVVLNTWEAVYFDHSMQRLCALADVAAEIGVERFVIDDGWFGSRRTDRTGLGDWFVSPDVWPDGLGPIADYVRARGMDFGLWFEPEMISPDSELARTHPDWILGTAGRLPPPRRSQQVLDLGNPDAYAYLLERIAALVAEYDIAYIKWDHNRDTADPVHRGGPRAGRPALHEQITAVYRLMDELRAGHPGLEIESCASGGARIDYGVLELTDRVWPSDNSDPHERLRIVPAVATLLPLELVGAHVASTRSHITGRVSDLGLRLAVALFGHSGFEWDLTETTAKERQRLSSWVGLVKDVRHLVQSGTLVRLERPADPHTTMFGVVAPDRDEALFILARLAGTARAGDATVRFAGLDPARRYLVQRVDVVEAEPVSHKHVPVPPPITLPGLALMTAGLAGPGLHPEQAVVYRLRAIR